MGIAISYPSSDFVYATAEPEKGRGGQFPCGLSHGPGLAGQFPIWESQKRMSLFRIGMSDLRDQISDVTGRAISRFFGDADDRDSATVDEDDARVTRKAHFSV